MNFAEHARDTEWALEDARNELKDAHRKLDILLAAHGLNPDGTSIDQRSEQDLREMTWPPPVPAHVVTPRPDAIVFGADMRELPHGFAGSAPDFPVLSTCICGRPVVRLTPDEGWQYCG